MTQEQYNTLWQLLDIANKEYDSTLWGRYGDTQVLLQKQYPELDNNRPL